MKLRHFDHDGRARFITFCVARRIPLLTNDAFRHVIADCIAAERIRHGFRLLGYVLMPEHIHLVIVPQLEGKIGDIIGDIKRVSSETLHEMLQQSNCDLISRLLVKRDGEWRFGLWQRRCYDHNCRNDEAVWRCIEYCHQNPVSRGLVRNPEDWRWSSYQWYTGGRDVPLSIDDIG
jgi:putative transposase